VSDNISSTAEIYWNGLIGLLHRDVKVLARDYAMFLLQTLLNPLLFLVVFTYVFPKIGQHVTTSSDATSDFGTILLPGMMAVGIFFQGVTGVAAQLAIEIGATREIHDRVMAPLPVALVAIEKILFSALQSIIAAVLIFPLVYFVPASPVHIRILSVYVLAAVIVLASLTSGALGLALGTSVKPQKIGLIFSIFITPVTFFGCVYYPWQALSKIPWLKWPMLLNPLVYMSEGLRATLTSDVPHMRVEYVIVALIIVLFSATAIGIQSFTKRITN
jgi:ABC-2 type transport system permease protein